jgi:hypothetical protein
MKSTHIVTKKIATWLEVFIYASGSLRDDSQVESESPNIHTDQAHGCPRQVGPAIRRFTDLTAGPTDLICGPGDLLEDSFRQPYPTRLGNLACKTRHKMSAALPDSPKITG